MLKIFIQGLSDGLHDVELICSTSEIDGLFEEFIGDVKTEGKLRILGSRYTFTGKAECKAKLICDRSLKEYTELITADLKISFLADDTLLSKLDDDEISDFEENIISQDDKYLNITDEVRELLAVNLPMKRIAPEYQEKEIEEIFPQYTAGQKEKLKNKQEEKPDERWAALKNIKLN